MFFLLHLFVIFLPPFLLPSFPLFLSFFSPSYFPSLTPFLVPQVFTMEYFLELCYTLFDSNNSLLLSYTPSFSSFLSLIVPLPHPISRLYFLTLLTLTLIHSFIYHFLCTMKRLIRETVPSTLSFPCCHSYSCYFSFSCIFPNGKHLLLTHKLINPSRSLLIFSIQ